MGDITLAPYLLYNVDVPTYLALVLKISIPSVSFHEIASVSICSVPFREIVDPYIQSLYTYIRR